MPAASAAWDRRRGLRTRRPGSRGASVTYLVPGSDSDATWQTDQRLPARGWAGGSGARAWLSLSFGAVRRGISQQHGGSRADPRDYGATMDAHAFAVLGSGDQTGAQVAASHVTAWASLGVSASASTRVSGGITYGAVTVRGARRGSLITAAARALAPATGAGGHGNGRIGSRRAFFGSDVEQGNVAHTGWIWQRLGVIPGNGRIVGVGVHGASGYGRTGGVGPRVAVALGGPFATPGTFTSVRYADINSPISGHAAGFAGIEALPVTAASSVWIGVYSDGTGGMSRRAHAATPTGQFDWTVNEAYRTASDAVTAVEAGSFTPTLVTTANFYSTLFAAFEAEAGGYQGNGVIPPTWVGAIRDAATDTPSSLTPSNANDSFRHTKLPLNFAEARTMRIAVGTSSDTGAQVWLYGTDSVAYPMTGTMPLLGGGNIEGPPNANAYNTAELYADGVSGARPQLGKEALAQAYFLFGNCWGLRPSGGVPAGTTVLFDAPGGGSGENIYANAMPVAGPFDRANDAVIDPLGLTYTPPGAPAISNVSCSQSLQNGVGMPRNDNNATLPATFQPNATDTSFGSILRCAIAVYAARSGFVEV